MTPLKGSSLRLFISLFVLFGSFTLGNLKRLDRNILEKLLPRQYFDLSYIKKVNISQEEYASQFGNFLREKNDGSRLEVINLVSSEKRNQAVVLSFESEKINGRASAIDSAEVRMLIPPIERNASRLDPYIVVEDSKRNVVIKLRIYLSRNSTQWVSFRVSDAIKKMFKGKEQDWKLTFSHLLVKPLEAYLNLVVFGSGDRRIRRDATYQGEYSGEDVSKEDLLDEEQFETDYDTLRDKVYDGPFDCDKVSQSKLHKYKPCCRSEIMFDLELLKNVAGALGKFLANYMGPNRLFWSDCEGKCPSVFYYDDIYTANHTWLHRAIKLHVNEQVCYFDNNKEVKDYNSLSDIPDVCCAPSQYTDTTFLAPHSYNPSRLGRYSVRNFFVIGCKCT